MSQVTELLIRIKQQGDQQLTRLQGNLKSLAQQTSATNVNFKELSTELKQIQQTSVNSINNLRGYANTWREIANSVKIGSAEFKQATAEAKKLEAELQKVQPSGRGRLAKGAQIAGTIAGASVFGGFEGGLGAGIGAIVGGVPGSITGGAIGAQAGMFRQMLGGVATYAADLSRQRQALQLVTKDAGEYQRALSFIDRTSRDLAIPQEIITRQFTQLTASVKGAGGNVRDAEKAFLGVASGIRGTGGSLEQLDSALTATSQVFSKGKVSAEELRQQIGERLPGAFSLFAKSIGMTPQELDKALEKGQISLQDFQKFSEKLLDEYGESAKILADGPDAAGDRLKVVLSDLKQAIGPTLKDMGASFQNFAAEAIKSLLQVAKELEKFGKFMEEKLGGKLLDNAIKNVQLQTPIIQRLEAEQLVRIGGLSKEEKQQLQLARTLRAGSMRIIEANKLGPAAPTPEPPSKLPGITPEGGADGKSILNKLQSDFSRSIAILGQQFNNQTRRALLNDVLVYEEKITQALKKGNIGEADRLQIMQKRRALEITRDVLINEETALENKILDGKAKGLDLTSAQIRLDAIRLEREQAVAAVRRLDNDQLREAALLVQRMNENIPGYGDQGAEPITIFGKMKEEIESLKDSFIDIQPRLTALADGLANSFSNAFSSLVFSAQSARETLAQLFGDIAKSFQNMVIQMITDYLKLQIMTFFQNLFAPSLPGIGGNYFGSGASSTFTNPSFAAGNIGSSLSTQTGLANPLQYAGVKFAMGGIMTGSGPLRLRRYAGGGIASSPQLAMFGEGSRPEAYVPLPDGRTIPVTMKNGGGGVNVRVNVDASGSSVEGDGAQANQLGKVIGIAVQQELIKQKRPGGLLA